MIKPQDQLVSSQRGGASAADDASRFAACCAVASCELLPAGADDAVGGESVSASGEADDSRQLADLSMIVCMATAKVRSYTSERGCQLRLELPTEPLLVKASPAQLEAALINLLRGAVDASATAIVLTGHTDGEHIHIHVEDNRKPAAGLAASGRSSDELARSIAKRILEDHGGRIDSMHNDQRGGSVWLTLPRQCVGGDGNG
jgi:signal transduction histidine kinase